MQDQDELDTWSHEFAKVDATYKACVEKGPYKKPWMPIEGYVIAKKLNRHIGRNYLPLPGHGNCDLSCKSQMFIFFRRRALVCGLERFRNWEKYKENEKDLVVKDILEAMGVPIKPWSLVAVGPTGVEYDLTREKVEAGKKGLIDRLEHAPTGPCSWEDCNIGENILTTN
ncbi:hypothetical protein FRC11_002652 [Ceratobasidium sp. 423]|nr:hypothetical protein FRC11_002652 [Ceratobasidium sp. 423]